RLLIFKEQSARNFVFPGSAAFSAAEKRDYEPCFAARQQLFALRRCDCGVQLPYRKTVPAKPQQHCFPSFRAAFP
ncbi:hypothetical protein, partial [Burkholderia seminalis]|uniref:hypothetical protein n=1 Tax=Burkholderia seminalis TaxID=488731 RepID=UPI00264DC03C